MFDQSALCVDRTGSRFHLAHLPLVENE
jgi:hypothetical protein